jgi:hypothetical protein
MTERLANVRAVHSEYHEAFKTEKLRLQKTPDRNQFDFPAMGVFGKSDAFMGRVDSVQRMYGIMEQWKLLQNSQIDGLEQVWAQAKTVIRGIVAPAKPYDPLDIRQLQFEPDSANFFAMMANNEKQLQAFCDKSLAVEDVTRCLKLLRQFDELSFLGVSLADHYKTTIAKFGRELERVKKTYMAGDACSLPPFG